MNEKLQELIKRVGRRNTSKTKPLGINRITNAQLLEIDRQARAYGWEIGQGQSISKKLEASENNPFLNPNWRDTIRDGD